MGAQAADVPARDRLDTRTHEAHWSKAYRLPMGVRNFQDVLGGVLCRALRSFANYDAMEFRGHQGRGELRGEVWVVDYPDFVSAVSIEIHLGVSMTYSSMAAASVTLGLTEPRQWPPIFGHWSEAFTVGRYWGFVFYLLNINPLLITK